MAKKRFAVFEPSYSFGGQAEPFLTEGYDLGYSMRALHVLLGLIAFLLAVNVLVALLPSPTIPAQEAYNQLLNDFSPPDSMSLCEEPIPLENRRVLDKLDRELTIAAWDRAQVFLWLKREGRYFPYIEEKLAEAGMPGDLKYLAVAESALITNVRSSKRAVGLWQFRARTGRRYGLRKDYMIDERLDFEQSTEAALKYLKHLHDIFDNWTLALAAYNCGEALLKKEIRKQEVKDYYRLRLPLETERFIFRIAAVKIIMENPELYGFNLPPEQAYRPIWYDTVPVRIRKSVKLIDLARTLGTDFKVLKELNPQIRRYHLPPGDYAIKVPPGFGSKVASALHRPNKIPTRAKEEMSDSHYVVREGDTLGHIAERTKVSIATLRRVNGIQGSMIRTGQKLRLIP